MSHENELEVQRSLGRIEGGITEIHATMKVLIERQNTTSKRVRSLERWRNWTTGIVVGVSALASLVWTVLTHK